jgi:transcriptional regulator with XRE-family HTH domain
VNAGAVGPLLRRMRTDTDLTLERLSALSGVSARALSDIERGMARGPQHRTVLALARALHLSPADQDALVAAARAGRRSAAPPPLPPVPRDTADFTGRSSELAQLMSALVRGRPVLVSGPPGYGKTALAVRAAHRLRDEFPDQVFVELGGTAADPPPPAVVATRVLRALTGRTRPPDQVPGDLRRALAERPVLLVLDDAATESQVRGLQRAAGGTPVLVTSRRPLAGLDGVQRIAVDRLPAADARRLLAALVPAEGTTARDLARLAELCDHVPLALRIAGNRVASRPGWTAAGLVDRLAVRGCRLDTLTAGDLRLRTAISTSVDRLPTSTRRLSRLSGRTFGAASVAAVAAVAGER